MKNKYLDDRIINSFSQSHLDLSDPLSKHVSWAFEHIYSVAYPNVEPQNGIARCYHGIQHVTRVALYIPIFANLYRKQGDPEALALTAENIKLLQLAAIFHDAAREDEGIDRWDYDSALLFYHYLTITLGINKEIARLFAECIANKDCDQDHPYFELRALDGEFTWHSTEEIKKNIYQKLIHDADCLDIIRARPHFDKTYLDYHAYTLRDLVSAQELETLINQARSLIVNEGDAYGATNPEIKKTFENQNALALHENLLAHEEYSIAH